MGPDLADAVALHQEVMLSDHETSRLRQRRDAAIIHARQTASPGEIARALGITRQAVAKILSRAFDQA